MKSNTWILIIFSILIFSCSDEDEDPVNPLNQLDQRLNDLLLESDPINGKEGFILPRDNEWNEIPQDPNNPITEEKVVLGSMLFHETGLAVDAKYAAGVGTYSCASCHNPASAFQPGRRQGIADGGVGFGISGESRERNSVYPEDSLDVQPIKVPSTLNVAYQENLLWNGQFGAGGLNEGTEANWVDLIAVNHLGYQGMESQAIAGLEFHRMDIKEEFMRDMGYMHYFRNAFPGVSDAQLTTREYAGLAIAAYVRTLISNQAPFQEWLSGNLQALTNQQKRGAILFFDKAACDNCHAGPALNSMQFSAVGMGDLEGPEIFQEDHEEAPLGRGGFTRNPDDYYKFKVPQLYNLKDAGFLGHGGTFNNLRAVVEYFNDAQKQNPIVPDNQLSEFFEPLNLTEQEIDDLTAFLEEGLHDPYLERYLPEAVLSGNCFPNNDNQSKIDLDCD